GVVNRARAGRRGELRCGPSGLPSRVNGRSGLHRGAVRELSDTRQKRDRFSSWRRPDTPRVLPVGNIVAQAAHSTRRLNRSETGGWRAAERHPATLQISNKSRHRGRKADPVINTVARAAREDTVTTTESAPVYVTSGIVRLTRPQLISTMTGLLLAALL